MKFGTTELIVILLVVIILFGPTQIPKLTKMFGKSVKGFRDGIAGDDDSSDRASGVNSMGTQPDINVSETKA